MIASDGIIIRMRVSDISTFARPSKGVRVMRVGEGEKILSVATAEHDEDEITDVPETPDADAGETGPEETPEPEEATPDKE